MKISRRKTHVDINFRDDYLLTKGVKDKLDIHFQNSSLLTLNTKKFRIRNIKSIFNNNIRVSKAALRKIWLDK